MTPPIKKSITQRSFLDQPSRIKAVLFDLDGTIRHQLPAASDVFIQCAVDHGLRVSYEDRIRAEHWVHFYFAFSLDIQADEKRFKGDPKAFWQNFTRRRLVAMGAHPSKAEELAPQVSACMEQNYKPIVHVPADLQPLLVELNRSGLVMGVVSNREEPYQSELDELQLASYFKFSLAGGEVNSYKPDGRIFGRALELAGTAAAETMYVGDNYFADVVGAQRAGLVPVLYDPISLFPDAGCAMIRSFSELSALLV